GITGAGSQIDINRNKALYPSSTTTYYHSNQINSSTLVTAGSGWPVWQATYLPYGEEYNPQIGTEHYKFTGKERDSETGLDYFGARYYGNALGRFITPDPKGIELRHLINPQKLNKYSYVLNNPMTLLDPNGMEEVTMQLNAFIQKESVGGFRGDNRSFSSDMHASSRVSVTVKIETDPAKNHGNPMIGKPEIRIGK